MSVEERTFLRNNIMESTKWSVKANLAIVLRGEVVALKGFVERMDELISETPEIELVHKHLSASKLWVKEGELKDG